MLRVIAGSESVCIRENSALGTEGTRHKRGGYQVMSKLSDMSRRDILCTLGVHNRK